MDRQLLTGILLNPAVTFKLISYNRIYQYKNQLIVLAGGISGLASGLKHIQGNFELSAIFKLILFIAGGIILTYIFLKVFSTILRFTGKWIKGVATITQLENVICYSYIVLALGKIILMPFYGKSAFENDDFTSGSVLHIICSLIYTGVHFYSLMLLTFAIAAVQNFSILEAIANIFLTLLLLLAPLLIIMAVYFGISYYFIQPYP